jgi:DNA-binding NtrC family response regulator
MAHDTHSDTPAESGHLTPVVLVVEDDSAVRGLACRLLEAHGYAAREAAGGRAALDMLRNGLAVSAVVTDLRMADGSGGWLLAQLAYEYPHLLTRVVVVSGDADGAGAAHVAVRWRCPVLSKPFTGNDLAAAIARLGAPRADVA